MDDSVFTPEFLSEFENIQAIDSGGMAAVYRAFQKGLERDCAIKVFQPSVFDEENARERFIREGKTTASLNHAHIVQVYKVGMLGDVPYMVLELVEGSNLKTLI